ncbi:MAG TPA: hypothetical protein HA230_04270 [Candidatus Aenigmarchaeota archaeon]|nr:hypothetical protein [Candidatus Aenigmarchaeota archaeon]
MKMITIKVNGKKYRVKDCRGLSSVMGMMFDKKSSGALIYANSIWMPFCPPLILFFLDEKFKVLSKEKTMPLTLNPKTWRTYSNKKAKYCLEIKV